MISFLSQKNYRPEHVYIEETVSAEPLVQRILSHLPQTPQETIADAEALWTRAKPPGALLLAKQRGPFLRYCPGTPRHICCLYQNLDVAAGCDLGCSYCILQGYLNTPCTTLYVNINDMFAELHEMLRRSDNRFFRIGTGELSDSMTFDHLTGLSVELVNWFSRRDNAVIELKSKNVHIDNLLTLDHRRRTVVSWSVNAEPICRSEEAGAPILADRLAAAREVQRAGYLLGFHFDPMIYFKGWQDHYRETVERIFTFARPENIAWISLGALRYPAAMDDIIRQAHPRSEIVLGELLPGVDKKLRYFKPQRIDMFRQMKQWINAYGYDDGLYLCMESDEVWRRSFGWSPGSSAGLKKILDNRSCII
jgi:spore photoproduct lyase